MTKRRAGIGGEKWGGGMWVIILNIMVRTGITKKVTFEPRLQRDKCFAIDPALPVPTSYLLIQSFWEYVF